MSRKIPPGKLITYDGHVVQTCPFLAKRTAAYNTNCVECYEDKCGRMKAAGLDIEGNPLPEDERPECGAKTRSGIACRMRVVPGKRRCRVHGGLSTGPKTEAGREVIRTAQKRRWTNRKRNIPEMAAGDMIKEQQKTANTKLEAGEPKAKPRKRWRRTKKVSGMAV